ncbi:Propeptide PepSY amd peptidase M4 [Bacillus cereus AH676]|nr:Propeptide PepSY amd peptidase M4 [Bacillus cereus AH676]
MKNIKNLLIVVGKFVILMPKLGERFGVSKIKRVIFFEK